MKNLLKPLTQIAGYSRENRPIEIDFFNHSENTIPLNTLFIGVYHGDEGIAGELMQMFKAFMMTEGASLGIKNPFAILPVLNPDGLSRNTRVNSAGVDLNRNYPTQDWVEENHGTPYYSGIAPASEPETQIVLNLIASYRPQKIITVHSPYKVINYDGPARGLANAMAAKSHYPVVESIGYPTPGSFGTYAGKELNIPVITLELPEDEPLENVWQDNRNALIEAIQHS